MSNGWVSSEPVQVAGRIIASYEPPPKPVEEVASKPEPAPPQHLLGLSREQRMRHVYAVGKSGTGKTTLLKQLLLLDFTNGDGCAFIDPHGDAAFDLLGYVPDERRRDVTYFDPTSPSAPAFNLLALPYPAPKLAEDILSTFKLLFGSSWGPRLEHVLRFSLLTLLADSEPHSLKDLQTLLRRPDYRADLVARASNEQVRDFWQHEFSSMPKDAAAPILNKLSALLTPTSDLERVLSSTANALDFPAMLDGGGIFIANLAKGKLGDEPSRLLGALLATAIQQAALARADQPAEHRRDFYFYVDEFQNYAVASFGTILSEARKYRLSLTLANQTLSQIPSDLLDAIFGNVATLVAFQVSANDATRLGREMHATTTRAYCREKGASFVEDAYEVLDGFRTKLPFQVKNLEQIIRETNAELAEHARQDYTGDTNKFYKNFLREKEQELEKLDPAATLLACESHPSVAAVRECFRDYEWWEDTVTTPSPDDLLNLKTLHAFVRVERAENVAPITVPFPPALNTVTRDAILAQQAARARVSAPPPPPVLSDDASRLDEMEQYARTLPLEELSEILADDRKINEQRPTTHHALFVGYPEALPIFERVYIERTNSKTPTPKPTTDAPKSRRDRYSF